MIPDNISLKIQNLLRSLGITENYIGFSYAVCAIQLSIADLSRLQLITKLIYPEVAKQCCTTSQRVERNIRTVSNAAWENNPSLLAQLAGCPLERKPSNSQFLAILTRSCVQDNIS